MYHLHYSGESHGPYLIEQIKTMWASGVVTADAVYWNETTKAWEPVTELLNPSPPDAAADAPEADQPPLALPPSPPPLPAEAKPETKKRSFVRAAFGCLGVLAIILVGTAVGVLALLKPDDAKSLSGGSDKAISHFTDEQAAEDRTNAESDAKHQKSFAEPAGKEQPRKCIRWYLGELGSCGRGEAAHGNVPSSTKPPAIRLSA